eukprot:824881-Amphidinium_carterae.1
MPLALKRSPSCRRLRRKRAGKALLTHAPTSTLGSWPSNSQSSTQEAAHHAVSLEVRTLNLCGFPEEFVTDLSELLASADVVCLQEVLVNRLGDGEDIVEYELPDAVMILRGFMLPKLVGSAATESPYPESRLRARLTHELLDRFNLVMGSTFTDGVSFERAFVGTYCHWSAGRATTLDYVAA